MVTSCNNELYKRGPVTVRELLKARGGGILLVLEDYRVAW